MSIPKIQLHPQSSGFSRLVWGVMRLSGWRLSAQELLNLTQTALELGFSTIDHADIYGSYTCEALFGDALRLKPSLRQQLQLVSKCGIKLVSPNRPEHTLHYYDTSAEHIRLSVENSLRNLGTDYLDLLLIHRPDPLMDADETADALFSLVQMGKVRHVGVSNFTPSQFELLQARLPIPLITNQVEISTLHRAPFLDGTLDQCQRLRIAPMAWSPLGGGGLLSGDLEATTRTLDKLHEIGERHANASPHQVALAWLLAHPARIVPVIGTGNPQRLQAAAESLNIPLTRAEWFEIWVAASGEDVP